MVYSHCTGTVTHVKSGPVQRLNAKYTTMQKCSYWSEAGIETGPIASYYVCSLYWSKSHSRVV